MIESVEQPETIASTPPRCAVGGGMLIHLFFSVDDREIALSKAICATCGMRTSCLDGALERSEPHGVWGGEIVHDGVAVAKRPRRGRPRKTSPKQHVRAPTLET